MERELYGTTLKVYLYIVKSGREKVGVREVMRGLGMKSPSHAYYHLDKLVSMGLLEKRFGDYYLVKKVSISQLRDFIFIGRWIIPRFTFITVFFLAMLIYTIASYRPYELFWIISLISNLFGVVIGVYYIVESRRRLGI